MMVLVQFQYFLVLQMVLLFLTIIIHLAMFQMIFMSILQMQISLVLIHSNIRYAMETRLLEIAIVTLQL